MFVLIFSYFLFFFKIKSFPGGSFILAIFLAIFGKSGNFGFPT